VKSVNRGNAQTGGVLAGSGTMPVMAVDDAGEGEDAGTGGPAGSAADPARVPLRQLMDDRLLDALLERSRDEAGGLRLTGEGSMLGELVKAVLERALEAELTAHLGYERNDRAGRGGGPGNYRNGTIDKTVRTGVGPVGLAVPRDRAGTFEPLLVPKRSGRVADGLDDMIISLYAQPARPDQPRRAARRGRVVETAAVPGHPARHQQPDPQAAERNKCRRRPRRPAVYRRVAARQAHCRPRTQQAARRRERPAPPPARPCTRRSAVITEPNW
jgi:hypothetical protein